MEEREVAERRQAGAGQYARDVFLEKSLGIERKVGQGDRGLRRERRAGGAAAAFAASASDGVRRLLLAAGVFLRPATGLAGARESALQEGPRHRHQWR